METPLIHIKFIPLIKNILKSDSHYNLEIVPVASSVENIDSIEWKDVKDKIEYTIPMTYKIVIMKQSSREKCVKIYHSCVDIFSPMSLLNVASTADDIPRTISENTISKITHKCPKLKNIFGEQLKSKFNQISNVDFHLCTECKEIFPLETINSELKSSYKYVNTLNEIINNEVAVKDFKYTTIRNDTEFCCNKVNVTKNDCNNNRNLTNNIKSSCSSDSNVDKTKVIKTEIKEKHTITPVYNIRTEDNNIPTINQPFHLTSNLLLHDLNDYNIKNKIDKDLHINPMNYSKISSKKIYKYKFGRISPEIRVANFIQNMEMEILPLKIMLNDIINKCISSNFYTILKNQNFDTKKNTTDVNKNSCEVKNNLKSNRIVYSIVFHE